MKRMMSLLLSAIMVLGLVGCGGSATSGDASSGSDNVDDDKVYEIKLATVAAETNPLHQAVLIFEDELEKAAPGRFKVTVYPNSQLGGERDLGEGLLQGTLEAALVSTSTYTMVDGTLLDSGIDEIPFLCPSTTAYFDFMEQIYTPEIAPELEAAGFKLLANFNIGGTDIANSKHPVKTPDDMKGLKLRVWQADGPYQMVEGLGAMPVSMSFGEVYTGIQNGTVDGVVTSDFHLVPQKFIEVAKYHTQIQGIYCGQGIVCSEAWFSNLPADLQDALVQAGDNTYAYIRDTLCAEVAQDTLNKIEAAGGESVVLSAEEWKQFQDVAKETMWPFFKEKYGDEMFNKVVDFFSSYEHVV